MCFDLVCVKDLLHVREVNQGLRRTHHWLLNKFVYTIYLTEHREPALYGNASLRRELANPDAVVTIQRRGIGNYDLLAFFQPFEYLDSTDGVAPKLHGSPLGFGSVGCQHKHADSLLCLAKCGPADFQDIFESLELDRSVHAQIGTRTRRQSPNQRSVYFKRAFSSSRIDARNCSLD